MLRETSSENPIKHEIETLLRAGPDRHAAAAKAMSDIAKLLVLYAPLNTDAGSVVVEILNEAKVRGPNRGEIADHIRYALGLLRGQVFGARHWESGLDGDLIDAFPAVEVSLVIPEREPAGWRERWQRAGGTVVDGRCVALKKSGVLQRFNTYGHPFPPFDWNDALAEEDVDESEAEGLGLTNTKR